MRRAIEDDSDGGSSDDDAVILGFAEDQKAKLGRAPAWAHHLHDCTHATKREVARLRHSGANREMAVDAKFVEVNTKLDRIVALFGEESDDGEGGKGLVGEVRRHGARLHSLERDRNRFWGAMAAFGAAATAIALMFKAWVESIARGVR